MMQCWTGCLFLQSYVFPQLNFKKSKDLFSVHAEVEEEVEEAHDA